MTLYTYTHIRCQLDRANGPRVIPTSRSIKRAFNLGSTYAPTKFDASAFARQRYNTRACKFGRVCPVDLPLRETERERCPREAADRVPRSAPDKKKGEKKWKKKTKIKVSGRGGGRTAGFNLRWAWAWINQVAHTSDKRITGVSISYGASLARIILLLSFIPTHTLVHTQTVRFIPRGISSRRVLMTVLQKALRTSETHKIQSGLL